MFNRLRRRVDADTIKKLDKLLNLRCRAARLSVKISWLKTCCQDGIIPTFILRRLRTPSVKATQSMIQSDIVRLQEEWDLVNQEILPLLYVVNSLNFYCFALFAKYCSHIVALTRKSALSKFCITLPSIPPKTCINSVINLSSHSLSDIETYALSFGLKFCIPPRRINKAVIKAQFESLFQQISDSNNERSVIEGVLKSRLVLFANEICRFGFSSVACPLTIKHILALKSLATNKDLIITRPDKGSGVVLLDRFDYVEKTLKILSDDKKFSKINTPSDRSDKAAKVVHSKLLALRDTGVIDTGEFNRLNPVGSLTPVLYGLPKIHKPDVPIRPVLSMYKSATYNLAKHLCVVLKPVENFLCVSAIRDSFDLVKKLSCLKVGSTSVIASLDVTSLFTSIPVEDCLRIIQETVMVNDISLSLEVNTVIELLRLCICDVEFLFNGQYFMQSDGIAMGSPLGPILANIFMGYVEKMVAGVLAEGAIFYGRYVDDILLIAKDVSLIHRILDCLNNVHPDIKLTVEFESNGRLPFLDVSIHHDDEGLAFGWYHKETWSGQYLHFNSFVPIAWKRGLLRGLKFRLISLCSSMFLDAALSEVASALENNGYPKKFIHDNFYEFYPTQRIVKREAATRKNVFIQLPFLGDHHSHALVARLNRAVSATFPGTLVIARFTTSRMITPQSKDRLPITLLPSVVYKFTCDCDATYIGRTECRLGSRIGQHVPTWVISGDRRRPRSANAPSSAITRHLMECDAFQVPVDQHFGILHKGFTAGMNRILEAVEIKLQNPDLCVQKEHVFNLRLAWT